MHGRVLGLTDVDKRGDALTAPVTGTDQVLFVGDTADFEEDTSDGTYWVTIADTLPRQYIAVDHDANTVTLAADAGATFEIDDPVDVWDPSVPPAGAKVAEYLVNVMTDRGPVGAVVDHETAGFAGVDNLIGASVSLPDEERADGNVHVDRIFGRVPILDQRVIDTPYITLYQAGSVAWPDSTSDDVLDDWSVNQQVGIDFDPVTSEIVFLSDGLYALSVAVRWAGNSSGRRYIQIVTNLGVDIVLRSIGATPPDAQAFSQQITVLAYPALAGERARVKAHQTSGASLDMSGDANGRFVVFQAVRLQA